MQRPEPDLDVQHSEAIVICDIAPDLIKSMNIARSNRLLSQASNERKNIYSQRNTSSTACAKSCPATTTRYSCATTPTNSKRFELVLTAFPTEPTVEAV